MPVVANHFGLSPDRDAVEERRGLAGVIYDLKISYEDSREAFSLRA